MQIYRYNTNTNITLQCADNTNNKHIVKFIGRAARLGNASYKSCVYCCTALGEGSGGLYWTQTYATYLSSPASLHLGAHLCFVPLVKGLQPMLAFIPNYIFLLANAGTERIHGKTACLLLQDTSDHPLTLTQLVARRKIFRHRLKIFGQFDAEPSLHCSCHLAAGGCCFLQFLLWSAVRS